MDNNQTREFLNYEVKPLWPKWRPSEPEVAVWQDALQPFDFSAAKSMIREYFQDDGARHARPRLKEFSKTRSRNQGGRAAAQDPQTDVYIECVEAEEYTPGRSGQRKPIFATEHGKLTLDPDKVMRSAENARLKCERLYGGRWITVRTKPPVDDGLRGPSALRQAEQNILAGADTLGKRFLLRLGRHLTHADLLKAANVLPERPDDDIPF